MSIKVGGTTFTSLSQNIYANGEKVYEVWVNGEKVYPDDGKVYLLISGGGSELAYTGIIDYDGVEAVNIFTGQVTKSNTQRKIYTTVSATFQMLVEFSSSTTNKMEWEISGGSVMVHGATDYRILDSVISVSSSGGGTDFYNGKTEWYGGSGYFSSDKKDYRLKEENAAFNYVYSHDLGGSSNYLFNVVGSDIGASTYRGQYGNQEEASMYALIIVGSEDDSRIISGVRVKVPLFEEEQTTTISVSYCGASHSVNYRDLIYETSVDFGVTNALESNGGDEMSIYDVL